MSLDVVTETETGFIRVSISRRSSRLKSSESQPRDRVRDHRIGRDRDQYRESRYTLRLPKVIVNNTKDSFRCRAAIYNYKLTIHIRHARSLENVKKDVKVFICLQIKL